MISAVFSGTTQWNGMCVRHRSTLLLFIVIIIIKQVVVTLRCDRNSNSTMCKQWQTCIWICADVGVVAMDSNISRSRSMEIKRGRKEFAHSARHAQLLGYDLFFFLYTTQMLPLNSVSKWVRIQEYVIQIQLQLQSQICILLFT